SEAARRAAARGALPELDGMGQQSDAAGRVPADGRFGRDGRPRRSGAGRGRVAAAGAARHPGKGGAARRGRGASVPRARRRAVCVRAVRHPAQLQPRPPALARQGRLAPSASRLPAPAEVRSAHPAVGPNKGAAMEYAEAVPKNSTTGRKQIEKPSTRRVLETKNSTTGRTLMSAFAARLGFGILDSLA